jgi:FkbM family methyltransferase
MNNKKRKSFFSKLLNVKILSRYLKESYNVIKQGYHLNDKAILFLYFLRIPIIVAKSVIINKTFREIEEERKHLSGNVTLKNNNGLFFCGNNILTIYSVNENQEKNLYSYFECNGEIFIDVGAHIGKYSIKLGQNKFNKIIALEPNEYNFSLLKKNIVLNSLNNIVAVNKGVYSKKGIIPFYQYENGDGIHSIIKTTGEREITNIEVDTLDNITSEIGIMEKIGLIKIDVEGAEPEVLKGSFSILEKHHPKLIIEILKENAHHLDIIIELLKPYNYNFQQLDEDNYFFS